ncbi:MAG: glycosyltransferase family 2 protein [Candidatus Saliniplasma sp.]
MHKVSFIIPTLDEVQGITEVLESITDKELDGYEVEILVVDGGSTDGTRKEAERYGVRVFFEKGGKASAVRRGFEECQGDYVFLIDGDGSYPCDKISTMLDKLEDGSSMVLGSRFSGEVDDGAMSRVNRFGNRVLTSMANKLYGTEISDLCTGLRGVKTDCVGDIPGKGFEVEAGLHALMCDSNISEVPIRYKERAGESKLRIWDGFKIAKRLLVEKIKKKKERFFV